MVNNKFKSFLRRFFAVIFWFLLVFQIARASEELTSVSRIVGESPTEMIRQIQRDTLAINDATFYTHDQISDKDNILRGQFGSNVYVNMLNWDFEDVGESIRNFNKNELFILETRGGPFPLRAEIGSDEIFPFEVKGWQAPFEAANPLFLFDSPFGGAYLPKADTFISRLVRDATIIAPSAFNSPEFTKSLLCNLVDGETIGEVFRNARNFHFDSTDPAADNLIGLVLQSYSLLGNPMQKVNMQFKDTGGLKRYCKNNLENYAAGIEFLGKDGNYSRFRKHIAFEIPSFSIENIGEFSLINATNAFQRLAFGELALPMAVRKTDFPDTALITNFSLDNVGSPIDLEVNNLPSYEEDFTERSCLAEHQPYSAEFGSSASEGITEFIASIKPVEVISCAEGKFRLYRRFDYSVEYMTLGPAMIKVITPPASVPPGSKIKTQFELLELTEAPFDIALVIRDQNDEIVYEGDLNQTALHHNATFLAPESEGLHQYTAEVVYNKTNMVQRKTFSILAEALEAKAEIPQSLSLNPAIEINFFSSLQEKFDVSVAYYLAHKGNILQKGTFTKALNPGDNKHTLPFSGLTREGQSYTLTVEMVYLNNEKTVVFLLNTNNPPLLHTVSNGTFYENEFALISVDAFDYEGDSLQITTNDSRFSKNTGPFAWKTTYEDAGNHSVNVSVFDGLLSSSSIVRFEVINVTPPSIYAGQLRFEDGSLAAGDYSIAAMINNHTSVAAAFAQGGRFNISIPADIPSTSEPEGGIEGDNITFIIGEFDDKNRFTWHSGSYLETDLILVDLCKDVSCQGYCEGTSIFSNGSCSHGSCSFAIGYDEPDCGYGRGLFSLSLPNPPASVRQNESFTFKAGITCTNGSCGRINLTLDPEEIISSSRKSAERLTFKEAGEQTFMVVLPRNATVKKATAIIEGFQPEGFPIFEDFTDKDSIDASQTTAAIDTATGQANMTNFNPFQGPPEMTVDLALFDGKLSATVFNGCRIYNHTWETGEWKKWKDFYLTAGYCGIASYNGRLAYLANEQTSTNKVRGAHSFDIPREGWSLESDGAYYFTNKDAYPTGAVKKWDTSGNLIKSCPVNSPGGIAWNGSHAAVSSYTSPGVRFINMDTCAEYNRGVPSPAGNSMGLAYDSANKLYYDIPYRGSSSNLPIYVYDNEMNMVSLYRSNEVAVSKALSSSKIGRVYAVFDSEAPNQTKIELLLASDGVSWEKADTGAWHNFANPGNNFRWKLNLSTASRFNAPFARSISLETGYPSGISIDTGNDGILDYEQAGELMGNSSLIKLNEAALNDALNNGVCDCIGCQQNETDCSIPVVVSSETPGVLKLTEIKVLFMAIGKDKGVIPEDEGFPFFVFSDTLRNPTSCSLEENESCSLSWKVNASGDFNRTYEFYVIGQNNANRNESERYNVTISDCGITLQETNWSDWENETGCFENNSFVQYRRRSIFDEKNCGITANRSEFQHRTRMCNKFGSISVRLDRGWNLLSFPLVLSNKNLSGALVPLKGKFSYIFEAKGEKWGTVNMSSIIQPHSVFWIFMEESASLPINGSREPVSPSLDKGLHPIAYHGESPKNISDWPIDEVVYSYQNRTWLVYGPSRPESMNTLRILEPGRGYFVKKKG